MARLSAVMADYFIPRLTGLIGLLGLTIRATKSPELTTTTPRLTRRLPVKVPLGVLAASVHCLLVPALVTFPVLARSDESLRQFSTLFNICASIPATTYKLYIPKKIIDLAETPRRH